MREEVEKVEGADEITKSTRSLAQRLSSHKLQRNLAILLR